MGVMLESGLATPVWPKTNDSDAAKHTGRRVRPAFGGLSGLSEKLLSSNMWKSIRLLEEPFPVSICIVCT